MGDANNGQGLATINFTVNGHAHSSPLPFSTAGKAYHSIALPVPFSDLVVGAQNIKLSANAGMMVTNVNLALLAAADVPGFLVVRPRYRRPRRRRACQLPRRRTCRRWCRPTCRP